MSEYLDVYDENGNYIGKEDRKIVHQNALWHNTVHCWLYDSEGNVYFQIRKDENKLYTTASGHVKSGETIKEGFGREIQEEIGVLVNYESAKLVNINRFTMDKIKKDGSMFKDRAFSNVYVYEFNGKYDDFNFDTEELNGLVKVNAKDTLELLKNESGIINGTCIEQKDNGIFVQERQVKFEDFLVNQGEIGLIKYGDVLNKVIELNKK